MTEVQSCVGVLQVHCQAPLRTRSTSLSPSNTEILELPLVKWALSAAQLSPHCPSPLFSSLQASNTSTPPSPSACDSCITEERSNRRRPQAPTTGSILLPLCLPPMTVTYQEHFINRAGHHPHASKHCLPAASCFWDSHCLQVLPPLPQLPPICPPSLTDCSAPGINPLIS